MLCARREHSGCAHAQICHRNITDTVTMAGEPATPNAICVQVQLPPMLSCASIAWRLISNRIVIAECTFRSFHLPRGARPSASDANNRLVLVRSELAAPVCIMSVIFLYSVLYVFGYHFGRTPLHDVRSRVSKSKSHCSLIVPSASHRWVTPGCCAVDTTILQLVIRLSSEYCMQLFGSTAR